MSTGADEGKPVRYMLDTNICIYLIKRKPNILLNKLKEALRDVVCISAITLAELEHGVSMSEHREKNADALTQFLTVIKVLPFDEEAAFQYGVIRADLQKKGMLIGQMDLLIAAHAKSEGCVMVTNNTREFSRVEGLTVEDWTL